MAGNGSTIFGALPQTSNLRSGLVDILTAQIESGKLVPGQRLPTEQEIVIATGVSRTVVREALAALRARGLIATRQGLGAFVTENHGGKSFEIVPTDVESIDDVIRILELRLGVEAEAAELAALRRSSDDIASMEKHLAAIDTALEQGGSAAEEDFAFHRSILVATRNPHYARLFDAFGRSMLPRQWQRFETLTDAERAANMTRMRREHHAILAAIRDSNGPGARRALRTHLTRSTARFTELRDATRRAG